MTYDCDNTVWFHNVLNVTPEFNCEKLPWDTAAREAVLNDVIPLEPGCWNGAVAARHGKAFNILCAVCEVHLRYTGQVEERRRGTMDGWVNFSRSAGSMRARTDDGYIHSKAHKGRCGNANTQATAGQRSTVATHITNADSFC